MKSLVLYDSNGGNTEKVAMAIQEALETEKIASSLKKVDTESDVDFFAYDLIIVGSPVIDWLPTSKMMGVIKGKLKAYNSQGLIKPSAPIIPGKFAVCFGTYAGPHIGIREAVPMTKWFRSFLEHIGYIVLDEWLVPGRFKNMEELNVKGRLGDIRSRPDEMDLQDIKQRVKGLLASLEAWRD